MVSQCAQSPFQHETQCSPLFAGEYLLQISEVSVLDSYIIHFNNYTYIYRLHGLLEETEISAMKLTIGVLQ